jgi:hypothetical protein
MRKYQQIQGIGVLLLSAFLGQMDTAAAAEPSTAWSIVYVMSYDNNLESAALPIVSGLQDGLDRLDAADAPHVNLLVDLRDKKGLFRLVLKPKQEREILPLATEQSASEAELQKHLEWSLATYPAKKMAIVFLDHGGALEQMNYDENPGTSKGKNWMSGRDVGPMLKAFREKARVAGSDVELLFLQQCGRGSIENLYNFRDAARAILASETIVGAPNTYYSKTIRWMGGHPEGDGFALGGKIMDTDRDFRSYALVDGKEIGQLPSHLNPFLQEMMNEGAKRAPKDLNPVYEALSPDGKSAENNYDLLQYLHALASTNAASDMANIALFAFETWMKKSLVRRHAVGPQDDGTAVHWSGLSIHVPNDYQIPSCYKTLPRYLNSDLDEMWGVLRKAKR